MSDNEITADSNSVSTETKPLTNAEFFGDGMFDWQLHFTDPVATWHQYSYSEERWWGAFPPGLAASSDMLGENPWALGPLEKYAGNPIIKPTPGSWDQGHLGGGVHNGAVVIKDDKFYYVYRGERPIDVPKKNQIDYMCDIGVAVSDDGINFTKLDEYSPFFRTGDDRQFSYEDVNIAKYGDTYYLFCNQWDWDRLLDTSVCGAFLATSPDLLHWTKVGIIFPEAKRIHRNPIVLQNPHNEAVRAANGKFVMYINDQLIAYSDDMLHWESEEIEDLWPGGEGCFALADHNPSNPDDIILFTGGPHTGHFYAVGQVRFVKGAPHSPIKYLPRPVLTAETSIPYENGFAYDDPKQFISSYADCIFFNGLTLHNGTWWVYYGGSEYYTCLATSKKSYS